MSEATSIDETVAARPATKPTWMRVVIVTGSLLAVLLLGASGGLLLASTAGDRSTPTAGPVDVGFNQDMTVHHRQAVLMAGMARNRSSDPSITTLAYDIEANQRDQIGRMQGWLSLWDAAPLPTGGHMAWMADSPMMSGMGRAADRGSPGLAEMPGMASPKEIQRLQQASEPAFDVLFLQLMRRHHQGGAPMMRYAIENATVPQVRNLARQMLTAQTAESAVMADMLARRGAQPLPPPS